MLKPALRILASFVGLLAMQQACAAEDAVRYRVTVTLAWAEGKHGPDHPADAHFSRLIAVAHRSRYTLSSDGDTASSGLALIATNGHPSILEAELSEARRRKRVGAHVVVKGLPIGVGDVDFEVEATREFPLVSFVTMLAPSPDWFKGANAISLRERETWQETIAVPLWVWDAGADTGKSFDSPSEETQPRQSVRLSTLEAFLGADGFRSIGSAMLVRIHD